MDPHEVVLREVQRDGVDQVLTVLLKRVCLARVAAHRHAHDQVLPLDQRRRDALGIRPALDHGREAPACVAAGAGRAEDLDQHGVVDIVAERVLDGLEVGHMSVAGQLDAVRQACEGRA